MCVIVELKKGVMLPRGKFDHMVWNNWHSYGLVTLFGDNTMDVKKVVPKSGENDPQEIWDLLEKDIEHTRLLHVRHTTVGPTNTENCHPFAVYYDPKTGREILFMHNGTMHDYKPKKWVYNEEYNPPRNYINGGSIEDDDTSGKSDTSEYVDTVLTPYLSSMDFGDGHGDISNPLFHRMMTKFWPSGNRGLLIANDQRPLFLGDWKMIKTEDGHEIRVSNTDYFDGLKRGPEFERREEVRKAKEAEDKKNRQTFSSVSSTASNSSTASASNGTSNSQGNQIVSIKEFKLHPKVTGYELPSSLKNVCNDFAIWDRNSAICLGYATQAELEELYADKQACLTVMSWIFSDYAELYDELDQMEAEKNLLEEELEKFDSNFEGGEEDGDVDELVA